MVRSLVRALWLRCPHCGVGRVMASWFRVRSHCPECGLRFQRDEENEYWLGAYLLNFIVTEAVFAAGLGLGLLLTWPEPPWSWLIALGAVEMVATPILFFPFSRSIWLALDLVFRPVKPEDLA